MIESAVRIDGFGRQVRCDTLHDHIPAKNHIVQSDCYMTGTMSGQVDHFESRNTHVFSLVGEIRRNGLVEGLCEAINAEERFSFFFSESGFDQEGGEATTDKGKSRFMTRDRLHIQFMASNLCLG